MASRTPENLLRLGRAANRAVWRTGQMLASGLLDHYSQTLLDIRERGFAAYWAEQFRPYVRAAAGVDDGAVRVEARAETLKCVVREEAVGGGCDSVLSQLGPQAAGDGQLSGDGQRRGVRRSDTMSPVVTDGQQHHRACDGYEGCEDRETGQARLWHAADRPPPSELRSRW